MWQVLAAAAVAAGSGILAKKIINPIDTEKPISDSKRNEQECDQNKPLLLQDSIFPNDVAFQEDGSPGKNEVSSSDDGGKIFRFSSPEEGLKELKKKNGSGFGGIKKDGAAKRGKKLGSVDSGGKKLVVDQRGNGSGKRVSVCLKKRRTGKNTPGKCESCSSKKDNSFGWGVGIGIMYMMSAGKSEISRLNTAMDETTKIVQELKTEISRRKSSGSGHVDKMQVERSCSDTPMAKPSTKNKDKVKSFGSSFTEDGGCESTVHSFDQQPEVLEMDQLEAELECELQKLPWCATEGSGSEGRMDIFEDSNLYQCNGVLPGELDKKLSNLLIEQQESQIFELEHALSQAHSKLHEREAELQALKDCVKRLTEFSLTSASDEDTDEEMKTRRENEEKQGCVVQSVVGMKRAMGYDTYVCSEK